MDGCPVGELYNWRTWLRVVHSSAVKGFIPCAEVDQEDRVTKVRLPERICMKLILAAVLVVADRIVSGHSCGTIGPVVEDMYYDAEFYGITRGTQGKVTQNLWCWMEAHPHSTLFLVLGMPISPRATITWLLLSQPVVLEAFQEYLGAAMWCEILIIPHALAAWAVSTWMYQHLLLMPMFVTVGLARQIYEFRTWRDMYLTLLADCRDNTARLKVNNYIAAACRMVWCGKWLSTFILLSLADLIAIVFARHTAFPIVELILILHFAAMGVEAANSIVLLVMFDKQHQSPDSKRVLHTNRGSGGYIMLKLLGNGGFGKVYLALNGGKEVAIKRIFCADINSINKAMNEVRSLMAMNHPHVVEYLNLYVEEADGVESVTPTPTASSPSSSGWLLNGSFHLSGSVESSSTGTSSYTLSQPTFRHNTPSDPTGVGAIPTDRQASPLGGYLCLVMEYCPNGDLEGYAKQFEKPYKEGLVESWAAQIAHALQHLHEKGLVHRDLKPHNILVGRDGMLKVADFGLARNNTDTMRSEVGTLQFAAPELFVGGQAYTEAIDLFSFGCMLYSLVCKLPRSGSMGLKIKLKDKAVTKEAIFEDLTAKGMNKKLASITTKLLSEDPSSRPSAKSVYHEMKAHHKRHCARG